MINWNPGSLRAANFADAAAPSGGAITNPNIDPAGFASLLKQNQTVAPPPPPPPMPQAPAPAPAQPAPAQPAPPPADASAEKTANRPAAPAPAPAPAKPEAPAEPAPPRPVRQAAPSKPRSANGPGATGSRSAADKDSAPGPTTSPGTAGDASAKPGDPAAAAPALDPSLMPWLAGLQRTPVLPAGSTVSVAAGNPGGSAQPAAGDARALAAAMPQAADAAGRDGPETSPLLGLPAAGDASFDKLLADRQGNDSPASATHAGGGPDIAAAGATAAGSAPAGPAAPLAPASVAITTPVTAPDFAQELGLTMSVLAKDGVQHAELHLNPADMGPVSVQIVMDGTQAHVSFGADMAATRQAIEAGMPQLAGALADAGFTLAGGGVSQHAGGRGDDAGGSGAARGQRRAQAASPDAVSRVGTATRQIVRQGGVDLFA